MDEILACKHIVVFDLEATCDDGGRIPPTEMETIEIGAVMVDRETLAVVSELQAFVRPIRHRQLTPFCKSLTSICQQDVDAAPCLPEVIVELKSWLYAYSDAVCCSWGDYDVRQLMQDCRMHRVAYPLPGRHVNLKRRFSEAQGITKKLGMAQALERVDLALVGTAHRGIDDARNIARLLPYCVPGVGSEALAN
jgi:inhibitor of KinA sporulation pathway (predicted exonuclease)